MKTFAKVAPLMVLGVLLAACGTNTTQRAATGAIAGAAVAGPPGAVVGAVAGTVVSKSQGE